MHVFAEQQRVQRSDRPHLLYAALSCVGPGAAREGVAVYVYSPLALLLDLGAGIVAWGGG